jgi:hypothetical protein
LFRNGTAASGFRPAAAHACGYCTVTIPGTATAFSAACSDELPDEFLDEKLLADELAVHTDRSEGTLMTKLGKLLARYRGALEAWAELFTYARREEEESEERAAQQDAAGDDAFLAWRAWLTTPPTTLAGAVATLRIRFAAGG